LILTPVLLAVAIVPCGVGHGNCLLFALFFPLMVLPDLLGNVINPLVLACIQLPLYGVILGVALKQGYFKVVAVVLLVLHALAVFLVLQL
jgi:hypothetical protein